MKNLSNLPDRCPIQASFFGLYIMRLSFLFCYGGRDRTRTCDLLRVKQAL